jgi:hypothetical protein
MAEWDSDTHRDQASFLGDRDWDFTGPEYLMYACGDLTWVYIPRHEPGVDLPDR